MSTPGAWQASAHELRTVVIVNDNARVTGGADKIALGSAAQLAQRGYRVILFAAVGPVAPELAGLPGLEIILTGQHEILHDPRPLRAAVQGLWNRKSAAMAAELFATLDPATTIVHLHSWAKALSSSVLRAARLRGLRIVCTVHDYLLACPTGTLFLHPQQAICPLVPMSPHCIAANCDTRNYGHKLWRVARQAVQTHAGGLPGGVASFITLSALSEDVIRPLLPAGKPLFRVSNFVDAQQQPPAPVASNQVFAFSGRLVKEKGPLLFAQAATRAGVRALFIGSGDQEREAEVRAACPGAEITGWMSGTVMIERLRGARALVFPSRWYEAQPLVVLEAAAHGLPCVIADTCAAREAIVDGETGLLFRGGDVADLTAKLRQLDDPAFAAKLGRQAYDHYWASPPTLDRHVNEVLAVYRETLGAGADAALHHAQAADERSEVALHA